MNFGKVGGKFSLKLISTLIPLLVNYSSELLFKCFALALFQVAMSVISFFAGISIKSSS